MTTLIPARLCPPVQMPGPAFFSATFSAPGAALHCMATLQVGSGGGSVSAALNQNSARVELLARYGCGGYGVMTGLDFVSASGLSATIGPGVALMDGPVELSTPKSITLPDHQAAIWVWLTAGGALTYALDLLKPVTGVAIPLCCLSSSAGVVGGADVSGVIRTINGQLWRQTGDTGAPSDVPDAGMRLWTRTAAGIYFWDGASFRFNPGSSWRTISGTSTILASDESVLVSATAGNVSLTLPAAADYSGRIVQIVRTDSSANSVSISPAGSDAMLGAPLSLPVTSSLRLLAASSAWYRA